jgi:TatA/E family protein of Tat protein translocase
VDILGIGPLELVLILVIALLVFGPDKLPEIGAKLGKGVRELRQLSREISQGVNTLTEPIDEIRKPFDDAGQIVGEVSATATALRNPTQALQQSLEKQLAAPSAEPEAVVQTAEDNSIAPPRSSEPAETAAALPAPGSTTEDLIEPAAPAAPEPVTALDTLDDAAAAAPAPPSTAPAPAAAIDTLDEVAADAAADPSDTESPAQASER